MAEGGNWIKLYRKILEVTAWAQGSNVQRVLMITLMAKACWKPTEYMWAGRVVNLEPGQLITTLPELAELCDATISETRTALDHLQKLNFLTGQSTGRGRLISIVNWGKYQQDEIENRRPIDRPIADQSQASDRPKQSHYMYKNIEEGKKERKEEGKEGKKYTTPSILEALQTFENSHQSPELTAALKEWIAMRQQIGKPVKAEDFPEMLLTLSAFSEGDREKAIAIVKQSTTRRWLQFWDIKGWNSRASPDTEKPNSKALPGMPPPRIEDYAGDPEGFSRDLALWNQQNRAGENDRIQEKYDRCEATEEERTKILKAMGY